MIQLKTIKQNNLEVKFCTKVPTLLKKRRHMFKIIFSLKTDDAILNDNFNSNQNQSYRHTIARVDLQIFLVVQEFSVWRSERAVESIFL